MATIDTKIKNNLLILTVTGDITAKEFIEVVLEHYPYGIVRDVIWDLRNGSLQAISESGFKAIANAVKIAVSGGSRKGGKTVFVGSTVSEYNMSRFYAVIAEVTGVPIEYNVFRTIEEAKSWLELK
jgi:hypothetical protein